MQNIQLFTTSIDLSNGAVTIPRNSTGSEAVTINAFELSVPSTITVDVQYSIDNINFVSLYTGLTNTERKRGGVLWRSIKFTKTDGSTSLIYVNYGQGIQGSNSPDAPTTVTASNIPAPTMPMGEELGGVT